MSQDDSEGNRFGYVREMPDYDHTSLAPNVDRDYSGGSLKDTEKKISRSKKAAIVGTTALASGATYGAVGDELREMGIDPVEHAGEAVNVAMNYMEPSNLQTAGEAAQYFLQHFG